MPNQRKRGKRLVAVWLSEEERKALEEVTESMGVDTPSFFRMAIKAELKKGVKDESKNKNRR